MNVPLVEEPVDYPLQIIKWFLCEWDLGLEWFNAFIRRLYSWLCVLNYKKQPFRFDLKKSQFKKRRNSNKDSTVESVCSKSETIVLLVIH